MEKGSRTNGFGNVIHDSFHLNRERYYYDQKLVFGKASGWVQYDTDQDASYFGVWVNVGRREIVTFAEGDESLAVCPTAESFRDEINAMAEFYGDPPPAFRSLDTETGQVTEYYDERPVAP